MPSVVVKTMGEALRHQNAPRQPFTFFFVNCTVFIIIRVTPQENRRSWMDQNIVDGKHDCS